MMKMDDNMVGVMVVTSVVLVFSVLAYMMNYMLKNVTRQVEEVKNSMLNVGLDTGRAIAAMEGSVRDVKDSLVSVSHNTEQAVNSIKRDFTSAVEHIKTDVDVITLQISGASQSAQSLAEETRPLVSELTGLASIGTGYAIGYSATVIVLSFVALFRNLYTRNKSNRVEKKESVIMTERNVYALFDAVALSVLIPMLFTDGVTGAIKVWSFLKNISRIVRDATGVYSMYSRFMSSGSEDEFPTNRIVNEIADAADELAGRVEEHKQAMESEEKKETEPTALPPQPLYSSFVSGGSLSDEQMNNLMRGTKVSYGNICSQCGITGCLHTGDPEFRGLFRVKDNSILDGLYKQWDQIEDRVHLSQIKRKLEENPGLKVLVIFLMFGCLLLLARWYHAPSQAKVNEETWSEIERHKAELKRIRMKKEGKNKYSIDYKRSDKALIRLFKQLEDKDEMPSYLAVDDRGRLMHVDELGRTSYHMKNPRDGGDFGQPAVSESLIVMSRAEWAEMLSINPAFKSIQNADHKVPMREIDALDCELGTIVLLSTGEGVNKRLVKIDMSLPPYNHRIADSDKNVESRKSRHQPVPIVQPENTIKSFKNNLTKNLSCNYCWRLRNDKNNTVVTPWTHDQSHCTLLTTQMAKQDKIKKEAELKKKIEAVTDILKRPVETKGAQMYKEALINGPQFKTKNAQESIGWATVRSGGKLTSMNCTAMWSSVYVSAHIFQQGGESITFEFKSGVYTCAKSAGRQCANDSLFFPLPQFTLPQLRAGTFKVGDKCMLICRNGPIGDGNDVVMSQGVVREFTLQVGNERAYSSYNSVSGNCGAPVINSEGKVIGWHNAHVGKDNMFIPVSPDICRKVTSSESSF